MGAIRNSYKMLVGKYYGRSPLGIIRRRWDNNIKIGLGETGCEAVDWSHLAQDRDHWRAFVYMEVNLRLP
jgi:hypothetical protein